MPRRNARKSALLIVLVLAVTALAPVGAAQEEDPLATERDNVGDVDRSDRVAYDGLDAALQLAADEAETGSGAEGTPANVEAQVLLSGVDAAGFESEVAALGGEVLAVRGASALVDIPVLQLRALSRLSSVASVKEPARPIALIESEGVAESNAGAWQLDGYDGTDAKVAVIDLSFDTWDAAQAAGELPLGAEIVNFCPTFEGSDAHGSAVAEIVHDMAPAADLALICVDSIFDLETATDWVLANGVDVVVHSVAWLNSGRGDGTQPAPSPDNAVKRASDAGVLWVNAAGNFAEDHYGGQFLPRDLGGTNVHNWDGANPGDPDMNIVVDPGEVIQVYMKYDGWPTTTEDYDMVLYDISSTILAASFNDQTTGAEPIEFFEYVNATGSQQTVFLEIQQFSGTLNLEMDIFVFGHSGIQANTTARSIVEPASSPYAVAVGAVCWSTDLLETFSSRGPTIDGRIKPDISAADGVSTMGFGETVAGNCLSSFPGTSSAAPHVGGAAALVLDARPHFTADEVMSFLADLSQDSGPVGADNQFGVGELRLGNAISFFADIDSSIFKNDIEWLHDQNITGGCSTIPPYFCPADSITRGQMAAFLSRALSLPATGTDFFTDDDSSVFEPDINKLAAAGITSGCKLGPDSYCPADNVTRAQMASFLVDAFDIAPSAVDSFIDDNLSVHEKNINALAASGVTGGCALANSYCPANDVTRGQMAAFLKRAIESS